MRPVRTPPARARWVTDRHASISRAAGSRRRHLPAPMPRRPNDATPRRNRSSARSALPPRVPTPLPGWPSIPMPTAPRSSAHDRESRQSLANGPGSENFSTARTRPARLRLLIRAPACHSNSARQWSDLRSANSTALALATGPLAMKSDQQLLAHARPPARAMSQLVSAVPSHRPDAAPCQKRIPSGPTKTNFPNSGISRLDCEKSQRAPQQTYRPPSRAADQASALLLPEYAESDLLQKPG